MKTMTEHFYRWGWLSPAILPLTQLAGRSAFIIVVWLYFFWGLSVLLRTRPALDKKYLWLFGLLLVSYVLSMPFAEDPSRAFRKWIKFVAMSSVFVFCWMLLEQQGQVAARRLVKWIAILGMVMVGVAYIQMVHFMLQPGFNPTHQLKEDSMPFLLPFIVSYLYTIKSARVRWLVIIVAVAAILFYAFMSEGRAAQLAAVLAIFVMLVITLGVRWYVAGLIAIGCLAAIIAGNWEIFIRMSSQQHGLYDTLNQFTSHRLELWRNAIVHASHWNIIGCGMGNVRYFADILTFADGERVEHMHNFILDAWFETGWLGLLIFLTFLGSIIIPAVTRLSDMNREQKMLAGVALASVVAILSAGLLSFSYASRQFGSYLMLCLAILLWLSRSVKRT